MQIILKQGEWSSAKKTKTIFDECYRRRRRTFCGSGNVHVCNIGNSCIHEERITWTIVIPSRIQKTSHGNRCSTYLQDLVSEQDKISGLETFGWENHSWKYLSLIGEGRIINLQRTKVYVFWDSVLCLGKIHENPQSNDAWEGRLGWFKSSPVYSNFDRIDGEPMKFEWNIFPGFNTLQLSQEVKHLLLRLDETPENFTGRIIFYVDVQRHFLWIKRQWKRMRVKCSTRFSICKEIRSRTMVISSTNYVKKKQFRHDLREAQMAFFDLTQLEKVPYKGIVENQEIRKVGLSETHASGNREAFSYNNWWKANWWNKYQQERSRRTWNDEVLDFVRVANPDDELNFFCQDGRGVMNVFFLDIIFSTDFFKRVSYTCSSNYSVYDGRCAYTHLLHAHFLHMARPQSHPHFSCVSHTRMAQVSSKRCLLHECQTLSISPSPFSCLTRLCCSCTLTSTSRSVHLLAELSRPKSTGHAHLRTRTRSLATWPSPPSTQAMSRTSSTRSLLWTMTRCSLAIQTSLKSLTSRKTHARTLDCTVISQCLNPLFRTFLMMILFSSNRKQRKHASGNRLLDRERERERKTKERGGFAISVA